MSMLYSEYQICFLAFSGCVLILSHMYTHLKSFLLGQWTKIWFTHFACLLEWQRLLHMTPFVVACHIILFIYWLCFIFIVLLKITWPYYMWFYSVVMLTQGFNYAPLSTSCFLFSTDVSTGNASYLPATAIKSFPLTGVGFNSQQSEAKVRSWQK